MPDVTLLKNLKPAKRYSGALISVSRDKNLDLNIIFNEIQFVKNVINENSELRSFLFNPTVSKKDKEEVLSEVFKSRISAEVLNFLLLLSEEGRLNILEDILSALKNDINEIKNIVSVNIFSAKELNENQKNLIKTKLQNKLQKDIEANYEVNSSILGGIVIKINDTVIDLSLKKKIENLKKN